MSPGPEFSIVIASRDRPRQLADCLASLERLQTPQSEFEVIVVDDGSREPYEPWLPGFAGRMPLRWIRTAGVGPGQARNAGAELARGRYLALTDDDCQPAPDWLSRLAETLRADPEALVGGHTMNGLERSLCAEASQMVVQYLYERFEATPGRDRFFVTCNLAIPLEGFRALGGFDPRFTFASEDRDFADRWHHSGRRSAYAPLALVRHFHTLSLGSFLRQQFRYGCGGWRFQQARVTRRGAALTPRPAGFYAALLAYPFRRAAARHRLLLSALLALSQGAVAAGFLWEHVRSRG